MRARDHPRVLGAFAAQAQRAMSPHGIPQTSHRPDRHWCRGIHGAGPTSDRAGVPAPVGGNKITIPLSLFIRLLLTALGSLATRPVKRPGIGIHGFLCVPLGGKGRLFSARQFTRIPGNIRLYPGLHRTLPPPGGRYLSLRPGDLQDPGGTADFRGVVHDGPRGRIPFHLLTAPPLQGRSPRDPAPGRAGGS